MGVSIKSTEAERKLRRVSRLLGKSMTATVIELADGKLKELDAKKDRERIHQAVDRIVRRVKALPVLVKNRRRNPRLQQGRAVRLIVIDSSALVAILRDEPDRRCSSMPSSTMVSRAFRLPRTLRHRW